VKTAPNPVLIKARRHLTRRDPVLKRVITAVGPCTMWHNPDRFALLVRSIVSQQISAKAARSISARLEEVLAPAGLKPAAILAAPEEALRGQAALAARPGREGPRRRGAAGRHPRAG
jgi:DNA-3-methyladenine glycosylase II